MIILASAAGYLFGRRNVRLPRIAILCSLLLLGVGVYKIFDVYRQARDVFDQIDKAVAQFPESAGAAVPFSVRDLVRVDPGTGLWMVAIAGLLGAVLGMLVLPRKPTAGPRTPTDTAGY